MFSEMDIPDWNDESKFGLFEWWDEMASGGMAFHPDDPPSTTVFIKGGEQMFAALACSKPESIFARMEHQHGSRVYDASLQAVWECLATS
ncbi:hypothetical protein ACMG4M_03265 [Alcanivorax sp. IL3]|uniref:hypothetical protein n=1 Tax=unclassified Alcanivorax TaxID=2638842 RepID=UPI000C47FB59|nr:hypothetical protein [Alcanivorax sp.]|tara:strand:- start:1372 stop:1641 length:270 start_codon:yes stop_codon:yes gene_type:complete